MQFSQKKKKFRNNLLHFASLNAILNIFKKKMTLLANVFLNLRTPKNFLR